jgi:hypothetical protein
MAISIPISVQSSQGDIGTMRAQVQGQKITAAGATNRP